MSLFKTKEQIALEELARRIKLEEYQTNGSSWITDRFGEKIQSIKWSEYPEYKYHKWDGTKDPFNKAIDALSQKKWVAIKSATSVGKTYMLPRIIYWFLDVFPNSLVITTAPKKDQLKKLLWTEMANAYKPFKKIRPYSEFLTLNLAVDKRNKMANLSTKNALDDNLGTGWEAIGFVSSVGSGEDSATKMQGFHRENMLFVLDETPGINPAVITAIVNTSTASNNLIIAVGNPDSQIDALNVFSQLDKVEEIIISAYDHPNVVIGKEVIPGAVTRQSLDFREKEYGKESPFFQSRARGITPSQSVDSLIHLEWINSSFVNNLEELQSVNADNSHNALGIDVANSESGDMACLAFGKKNVLYQIQEFQCKNATHLAYNVLMDDIDLMKKNYENYGTSKISDFNISAKNIGIDSVGVGVATVNAFYDMKYKVISLQGGPLDYAVRTGTDGEDLYKFSSLRAQMYFELREDLRNGAVRINIQDQKIRKSIIKELTCIKYSVNSGKIKVESKEDIKKKLGGKSPNVGDSIVYWNWMRKSYYNQSKFLPFL